MTKIVLVILVLGLPGISFAEGVKPMNPPFQIILYRGDRLPDDPMYKLKDRSPHSLTAIFRNISDKAQPYSPDFFVQASLEVASSLGEKIISKDSRAIGGRAGSVGLESIPPNKTRLIGGGALVQEKGLYTLTFGAQNFILKPGKYQAKCVWKSLRSSASNPKVQKEILVENIWLGNLESNNVEFDVP